MSDDEAQDRLVRSIQAGVPFVRRPFDVIGAEIGITGEAVLEGLRKLDDQMILREISAVLEGSALGYASALVAGVVRPEDLDRAV